MKSYFLEGLSDSNSARKELCVRLPNSANPWLLHDGQGDVIAYFEIAEGETGGVAIQADMSGRHFNGDVEVIDVLRDLQKKLGGTITDDDDGEIN
ncbi:MAG: hypothetical protein C0486_13940 [Erythrobacter sp.]|nr:hypothetical protein [Erythrobacter sp.]MBA4082752.1 hypothetical protein [Erythrobacter sp.]